MVSVSKTETSMIQSIIDVTAFILLSIGYIIRAAIKTLLPKSSQRYKKLKDEVVLITGGGGGLGRLLALRLAKLEAIVVLWDINDKAVQETVKLVEAVGGKAHGFTCDLSSRQDVYRVAEITFKQVGQVAVLINNAGVVSGKLLLDTPDDLIQRTFDVNVLSHFWTAKAFLPKMIEQNHGHIVTVASMAGYVGINKLVDYCASKHAAVGFDEALRIELETLGVRGVKTTVICPYFIQSTGMFEDVQSRFMSRLNSNDVADRIIEGIRREELFVLIPSVFRYVFFFKWIFPWACVSMFLRGMIQDAAPANSIPTPRLTLFTKSDEEKINGINGSNLSHRISVSERKP